jgi:FkbM family methyltransferase
MKKIKFILKKNALITYFVRTLRFYIMKKSRTQNARGGFKFIGPSNMLNGDFEKEEFDFFSKAISECDIFINVGANIGFYVCAAISQNKKVLAFEPDKNNFELLMKNIELNDKHSNCLAFNLGVGDKWETLKIYHASTGSSFLEGWANNSSLFYNKANVIRIDDFSFENYKKVFFLVDVEGFESYVVEGAMNTISSLTPQMWMIEIMTNDEYGAIDGFSNRQLSLVSIFEKNNFDLFRLNGGGIQAIEYKDLCGCITNRESKLGHNFVFVKN